MGLGRGVPMQILSHQDVVILPGGYRDVPVAREGGFVPRVPG